MLPANYHLTFSRAEDNGDKAQIVAFAQRFVSIASKYIANEDDRLAFSGEIMASITEPAELDVHTPRKIPLKLDLIEDDEDDERLS